MKQELVLKQEKTDDKEEKTNDTKEIQKTKEIPKVLEQRLLINDEHRKVLRAMERLSPHDTGLIYIPGNRLDLDVPTPGMIAEETGMPEKKVLEKIYEIKDIWKISDHLPTNNRRLSKEEALISALTNQHKLRWDDEIGDYRIPRVHVYNAEMGTGMEYTANEAFEGEKIFRKAAGINEVLNSYHMQGGIMPSIIMMFGKRKNNAAIMTGINKTGKKPTKQEFEALKNLLETSSYAFTQKETPLTLRQIRNLKDLVVNTIDSMSEAAESVAYELTPLVKDIPSHVPIHMYWSFNDDSNLSEIEDLFIATMKDLLRRATTAHKKLPDLKKELPKKKAAFANSIVKARLGDYILEGLEELAEKYVKEKKELPIGKELRNMIADSLLKEENGDTSPGFRKFKNSLKKDYSLETGREDAAEFERAFSDAKTRYLHLSVMRVIDIENFRRIDNKKKASLEDKLRVIKDEVAGLELFQKAMHAEALEKHSWFTKKIAITPTQAKAKWMIEKMTYKDVYEEILIPAIKKIAGKELNIKLHTDREISIYVEDPATLLGMNQYPRSLLYGTIVTSVPRTNRQRSNEPLLESVVELQRKHETAISQRLKLRLPKPKTVTEFNKRQSSAFADVLFTSWGADGFRLMPKFVIDPPLVLGEYEGMPEIAWYLKCPTRHDTMKLKSLLAKGNRGTWEGKRFEKGGPTTGNVIQIMHPDQSQEWFFVDNDYYKQLHEKYGSRITGLERKLEKARSPDSKQKLSKEIEKIYAEIRPEMNYVFLANDLHFGSFNELGRVSNIDVIKSSQLAALQSLGLDKIKLVAETEGAHGALFIQRSGYSTVKEGELEDPVTTLIKANALRAGLRKQGMSEQKAMEHVFAHWEEQMYARSAFLPQDQKEMFKNVVYPVFIDLMEHNVPIYLGSGNHWNQSRSEDEGAALKMMFDNKYFYRGLLNYRRLGSGAPYTMEIVKLPSNPGVDVRALIAHKMWHGATEISALARQAARHKTDALFYITADRHHPGMVAELERYAILDVGKQTTITYVKMIGKASSVRGAAAMGYSPDRELMFSGRFWLDPVVQTITGWDKKTAMLKRNFETINKEMADYYTKK